MEGPELVCQAMIFCLGYISSKKGRQATEAVSGRSRKPCGISVRGFRYDEIRVPIAGITLCPTSVDGIVVCVKKAYKPTKNLIIIALTISIKKPQTKGKIMNARWAAPYCLATADMLTIAVAVEPRVIPPKPALITVAS